MQLPVRKENRLTYYDYSNDGRYYITICTRDKMCILWENPDITNGKVKLSEIGKIVSDELKKFPEIYDNLIYTSKYVIMPNHIHLIINI